jgi:hypothetical protein
MNIKKSRQLKTAVFVALLSATLYAAIIFNPATMPTITLAPYALKNIDLSVADNHAYRPWFENGAWQGDVIEYDLASDGTRTTDASVGSNPPVAAGNNWMARATFAARESSITDYWKSGGSGRNIFTRGAAGTQADFLWSSLSDAQKTALDADTLALGTNGAYDSPILNFTRGDRSNEKSTGGSYRDRYSLLGAIVNSNPVYIGGAKETFTIAGFSTFKDSVKTRDGRVAVGANDGMLHVFDADDGGEVYAYVPSMLLGKLSALKAVPYQNTYYVDGQITVASASNGGTWMSVLTGTLGAGGKGLYALNVTNPDMSSDKLLFEKTGADIGYILGRPRIARKNDGKWYIFTGNGINSTNGVAKLLMFELDGGTYTQTELSTGVAGGLSAPVLVDANKDFKADFAFAGDTNGDMWKFYLGDSPPVTNPEKIFDGSPDRPILTAPAVTAHPSSGYMVLWGTGSALSMAEATDTSYPTQAIYGVWDKAVGDVMVTQVLVEVPNADFSGNTETVRYIDTNNPVDYNCAANDATCTKGWVVELPNAGERILGPMQVRAGRASVMSSTPLGTPATDDLIGDSWLISLSYYDGGDAGEVAYNLNGDTEKDNLDMVNIGTSGSPDLRFPVALHLGDGNISQPALARLTGGTDIMYINGLRLPIPIITPDEGPFLTGHIDVHTDSPNTYMNLGGNIAPNNRNKHSELYNIQTSDGLGRGVDGHFHEYDTVNNVHYVDLFELEPRRGLPSAAAVFSEKPCGTAENEKELEVSSTDLEGNPLTGCLELVEGELNRAYDTLQTDADGNPDAKESEVYELTTTGPLTPLDKDQKFIVVVANGDLSPAAKLQIGCRVWDIVDYENMMTDQLEGLVETAKAPVDLEDRVHGITGAGTGTLVFSLDEIESGAADSATCPDDSPNPTIRVHFTTRDILDGAIHGTRSQCVLGLHDYHDPVDYWDDEVLCWAPKYNDGETVSCDGITDPGAAYIEDPADNLHITEVQVNAHSGFRWRNGALTIQLLRVNEFTNAAEYTLQDPGFLPTDNKSVRYGGTYAQAFTGVNVVGGDRYPDPLAKGPNESGLLYESSMYWHFGDLADDIQRGPPASIPCYGDPDWGSAFTQETRGLTLGQYQDLYKDIAPEVLAAYDKAILALEAALNGDDEAAIQAALLILADLLQDPDLAYYHKYRDYAPGNIPEQHLRDIDKDRVPPPGGGDSSSSSDDGIPVEVVDLEDLDTETVGPNFDAGRRTWIDLRL